MCYEMILVYVDDILCISAQPRAIKSGIQSTFKLKDDRVEKPENYLGAQVMQKIVGGVECWAMTSEQYVKAAIAKQRRVQTRRVRSAASDKVH